METADQPYGDKTLITQLNPGPDVIYGNDDDEIDSDQEDQQQAIFNVSEAVPPTDYDAPYSAMPTTVTLKKVKQKVKKSYIKMAKEKADEMTKKLKYKPGTSVKKTSLAGKKGMGATADKKDFKLP